MYLYVLGAFKCIVVTKLSSENKNLNKWKRSKKYAERDEYTKNGYYYQILFWWPLFFQLNNGARMFNKEFLHETNTRKRESV